MKQHQYSVREGERVVDVGTIAAEDEREALRALSTRLRPKPTAWYKIKVGALVASCRGDEFSDVAIQAGAKTDDAASRSQRATQVRRDALKALGEDAVRRAKQRYDHRPTIYDYSQDKKVVDPDLKIKYLIDVWADPVYQNTLDAEKLYGAPLTPRQIIDQHQAHQARCPHTSIAADFTSATATEPSRLVGQRCMDCGANIPVGARRDAKAEAHRILSHYYGPDVVVLDAELRHQGAYLWARYLMGTAASRGSPHDVLLSLSPP